MRAWVAAALAALVALSCGHGFGARDRFEGPADGKMRVYVRFNNSDDLDDSDRPLLQKIARERGGERLALITRAVKGAAGGDAGPGEVVYLRCADEYCEAFIDYTRAPAGESGGRK